MQAMQQCQKSRAIAGEEHTSGMQKYLRKECLKMRRIVTRTRKRHSPSVNEVQVYKDAKRMPKAAIDSSRAREWEQLKADVKQNPWGLGYKVVLMTQTW